MPGFLMLPRQFLTISVVLNEQFLPVVIGVTEYNLQIFNRWGQKIFETFDHEKGWDGSVNGGDHFSPNGVYSYRVLAKDLLGFPHEYQGHITIIR